jgi:tetratricopeptide (TPR) repeat protein
LGERIRTMKRIFISYSHKDEAWVKDWLLPRLEGAGLQVHIDYRDFEIGIPALINMEQAVQTCDKTLLVLSPNWIDSEWTNFEALMIQTKDPTGLKRRLFPLLLEKCSLPPRLEIFTYADFTRTDHRETELNRLITQLTTDSPPPTKSQPLNPKSLKIMLSKMPTTAPEFLGRKRELKQLDDAWKDEVTHVVCLVAWGGVGKTALVNEWLAQMEKEKYRGAERVYAWSFYSQGSREDRQVSADLFISDALTFFGDPNPKEGSPWDKGRRLAGLIREYKTLLILDGLEPVQYPPGEMQGKLKDQGMQALLKELCHTQPGLCVVTTRLNVTDLQHAENRSCLCLSLSHLSEETGARLLKTLGIQGTTNELQQASIEYRGHALALRLLSGYLKVVHEGDIRKRDLVPRLIDEGQEGGHAERVMAAYETFLSGTAELNILYLLGLFDRPAPPGAIDALRKKPVIKRLTNKLKKLDDTKWKFALSHLRDLHLLAPPESHRPHTLDCHPLVREYFAARLQQTHPTAWTAAHRRLYDYYKDLQQKKKPDTLEEMEPLFAAVSHGCRAGLHQEALEEVYWPRICRENEAYTVHKLGAFGADLAVLAGFFEVPWKEPSPNLSEPYQAWVLNNAGFRLRALGRLREAAEPLAAGLAGYIKQEDWEYAAIAANNLSELWLSLGAVARAIEYARQGVAYADRSGEWDQKMKRRTTLADGLHQAGQAVEAEELFRQAEAMQKKEQPDYPFLYSVQGFRFCDLLLSRGRYKEVLNRAGKALEWAKQAGLSLLTHALDHLSLGRAHMQEAREGGSGDFERAAGFLDRAVTGLREASHQEFLSRGLLARAGLYREMGDHKKAWADLKEAQEIAERGEMKLHLTDYHLEAARLCGAEGKKEEVRKHLKAAKVLIEETGYHRRDSEIKISMQIAK